jgi:hypothetical protein
MNDSSHLKAMAVLDRIRSKIEERKHEPKKYIAKEVRPLPMQAKRPRPQHPKHIVFPTFFRTFANLTFSDYSVFASYTYGSHWNLKKVVYPEPSIRIEVPPYLRSGGEPFPQFLELQSYNCESFTSGELFYKIHKALVEPGANERFHLRGAKLVANPHQKALDEGEHRIYGFYTNHEWATCEPAPRWSWKE